MENQSKNIKLELFKLSWLMRGGLSIDEAFALGSEEREIIGELVKENFVDGCAGALYLFWFDYAGVRKWRSCGA